MESAYQGLDDDEPKGLHTLLQRLLDLLRNLSLCLNDTWMLSVYAVSPDT